MATKGLLFLNFEMKDMDEVSYILGVKIHGDRSRNLVALSQETYIKKFLNVFIWKIITQLIFL